MPILGVIASAVAKVTVDTTAAGWSAYGGTFYLTSDGVTWTGSPSSALTVSDFNYVENISAANGNTFVNTYGGLVVSADGTNFTQTSTNFASGAAQMIFANGAYWTAQGAVATSTDGVTWTFPTVGKYTDMGGIAYGNGTFVAVAGQSGTAGTTSLVYTSPNGVTWTSRTGPNMYTFNVFYGNRFVTVGYDPTGSVGGRIAHSTDGVSWTVVSSGIQNPSGWCYSAAWSGSAWVASAYNSQNVNYSTDGQSWSTRSFGSPNETNWSSVAWGNGFMVGTNGSTGIVMTSPDGNSGWTTRNIGASTSTAKIAYAHSRWYVRTGYPGPGTTGSKSMIRTSTDAVTWTAWSGGRFGGPLGSTASAKHKGAYYALDNFPQRGLLWSSTNGTTWSTRLIDSAITGGSSLNGLLVTDALWVAGYTSGLLYTSSDGVTWSSRTNPYGATGIQAVANDPTIANKYLVAMGDGKIAYSTDGTTWTGVQTPNASFYPTDAIRAFGQYILVGNGGILTSPDAITWTARTNPTNQVMYALAASGTLVVAGGDNGSIITSTDGITWTSRTSNWTKSPSSLKFTSFGFVTNPVSNGDNLNGVFLASTDGISWTSRTVAGLSGYSPGIPATV